MKILFKNAKIISSQNISVKDVLVEDEKIVKVADVIDEKVDAEYDLTGKYLMPGVIDAHVHFRVPGYEEKEDWVTGSNAALSGGVTTVFDMPNTKPHTTTLEALEEKREIIAKDTKVNFGLFFGAHIGNLDECSRAEGIVGYKVYMGATTGQEVKEKDSVIDEVLEKLLTENKFTVAVHPEDEDLIKERTEIYKDETKPEIHSLVRNDEVEFRAARRAVHVAKKCGGRLHLCHTSTKKVVELLAKYPEVTAEVTPHHLYLSVKDYVDKDNFVKVNPPLRSVEEQEKLWNGIENGFIKVVASDHAPHLKEEKEVGYWEAPSGVPGTDMMLPLLLDSVNLGQLNLEKVVELVCENPVKIYGVKSKGFVREGYDADLVVVDMDFEREVDKAHLFSKCGWSPYEGRILKGWPIMTFVRGKLGMENGEIVEGSDLHGKEVEVK